MRRSVQTVVLIVLGASLAGCTVPWKSESALEGSNGATAFLSAHVEFSGPWNSNQLATMLEWLGYALESHNEHAILTQMHENLTLFAQRAQEPVETKWVLLAQFRFLGVQACSKAEFEQWTNVTTSQSSQTLEALLGALEARSNWEQTNDASWKVEALDAAGNPLVLPERCDRAGAPQHVACVIQGDSRCDRGPELGAPSP